MFNFSSFAENINIEKEIQILKKSYTTEKSSKETTIKLLEILFSNDSGYDDLQVIDSLVELKELMFYFVLLEEINEAYLKGMILSKRNNNYKIEHFYYYKGIYEEENGYENEQVIKTYRKSIKYSILHENKKLLRELYETLGNIYSYDKNIKLAFDNYKLAYQYVVDKEEDFLIKYKISTMFYFFNVNEIARDEILKLINEIESYNLLNTSENKEFNKRINDILIYSYENLTLISIKENNYEEAYYYAKNNFKYSQKSPDIYDKIISLLLMSLVESNLKNFDKSLEKINLAEKYIQEEENKLEYIFFNFKITKFYYYYLKKDHENANNEIIELENFLKENNRNSAALYSIYDKISKNLSHLKKYKKALYYQKEFTKNYIEKRNIEETSLSLFLYENYKSERLTNKNNEISILKKEKNNQILKNLIEKEEKDKILIQVSILIMLLIVGLIILMLFYKNNKKISITDHLTGLYNRAFFVENINKILKNQELVSIAILDIDNFKNINDTYGHDVGDDILIDFAKILKNNSDIYDFAARVGGEEFSIVMKSEKEKTKEKLEKIRKEIESHNFIKDIKITSSFGVADSQNKDFKSLYVEADKNLYKAKRAGKNRII